MKSHHLSSTTPALRHSIHCGDVTVEWEFRPLDPQALAERVAEHLITVLLVAQSGADPTASGHGVVRVAGFADLLAGRLAAAEQPLAAGPPERTLRLDYDALRLLGERGWAIDLPDRPRRLTIDADGVEIELSREELLSIVHGIDFHLDHADSPAERLEWAGLAWYVEAGGSR